MATTRPATSWKFMEGEESWKLKGPFPDAPGAPDGRIAAASPPPVDPGGRIVIRSTRAPYTTAAGLIIPAGGIPSPQGGVGGWEAVPRPGAPPTHYWAGGVPVTLDLTVIVVEGYAPVEATLQRLYSFGRRAGGESSPPTLRVFGPLFDQHSREAGEWVLQGLSLGDRRFRGGVLVQQWVTLNLESTVSGAAVPAVAVGRTRREARVQGRRTVKTRAGDTLRAIAVRELGDQAHWRRLADANQQLRKVPPDMVLRTGTVVRVA